MYISLCTSLNFVKVKKEKNLVIVDHYTTLIHINISNSRHATVWETGVYIDIVNRTVYLRFLTFYNRFYRLEIMHADIIRIL